MRNAQFLKIIIYNIQIRICEILIHKTALWLIQHNKNSAEEAYFLFFKLTTRFCCVYVENILITRDK